MKSTGIVRRIDELGRIVLPIELRNKMDIKNKDSIEIFVEEDKIILKKYEPACLFCGNADDVILYKGKLICKSCLAEMNRQVQ
ncbi:MAG: AbrB/MazE/SpoVT family DNA-binding domain-containing protein [Clostridia bacterium]|nr:AbrB/MazE/SpoVT family DNA-binding domain-containing protein [Clostridia bacterium]